MDIEEVVRKVIQDMKGRVPLEVSARHVHLTTEHIQMLFGQEALTPLRDLSQLGQFLSEQRVRLIGPKGVIENVAVLGPARKASQVEVSLTDSRVLGIAPYLRQSGDIEGTSPITISFQDKFVHLEQGAIIAKNHIHMNGGDAERLGVTDQSVVNVLTDTPRPLLFRDVLIRVDPTFVLNMHIDFDEANACMCQKDSSVVIVEK